MDKIRRNALKVASAAAAAGLLIWNGSPNAGASQDQAHGLAEGQHGKDIIHGDTDVPLGPASHGCIRIPMDIARFFHTEVPVPGTPVYVYR